MSTSQIFHSIEKLMNDDAFDDSSARLMIEQMQVVHRRIEAETISALVHRAPSLDAAKLIIQQRLNSLCVSELALIGDQDVVGGETIQ